MAISWSGWYWHLGLASFLAMGGAIAALSDCAHAQVTPDVTLGAESSVVTPTAPGSPVNVIDGGLARGANLFHSFEQFSVPTGGEASFNNALDIQNIISRVTGGSISNIDGLIRANGTANLFLLNPNGIIFGPNAQLNIGGSFLGSTANSLNFADGKSFSTTNPQDASLLTISVPVGLQFGRSNSSTSNGQNPGAIHVQGTGHSLTVLEPLFSPFDGAGSSLTGLRVQPGNTLALVGGDVALEGGILTAQQGRIELGSVGSGLVSLSPTPSGWTLGYEGVQSFQDVRLSQNALADASGSGGGDIQVVGRRVMLTDSSKALIQNQGSRPAGSISVNASESLELVGTTSNRTAFRNIYSEAVGVGKGGDIAISTKRLTIQDGAAIGTTTFSVAQGGNLTVNASESMQMTGFSIDNPTYRSDFATATYSSGRAGDITVSTGRVSVLNGAYMVSATLGTGSGGDMTVNATDSVELIGFEPSLFSPSLLSTANFNAGDAGSLTINTSRLTLRDGGRVGASTGASGDAGSLTINASESVEVSGIVPGARNPSLVTTSAGILDEGLRQVFKLPLVPSGAAGDVTINTARLSVTDGALVNVRNEGSGNAGTLRVDASSIFLDNRGGITAATVSGKGGNISLEAQNLLLRDNSTITASAGGRGDGGNINIDTDTLVALENSDISANATQSFGGRVSINAQGVFGTEFRDIPTPLSDITATGGRPELSGTVEINNPDVDPTQGLLELPAELVDASNQIATGCAAGEENEFIITGRGGLPPNPRQVLSSNAVQVEWVELSASALNRFSTKPATNSTIESAPTTIVEANGWVKSPNGEVTLVATAPTANIDIPWLPESSCNAPEPES